MRYLITGGLGFVGSWITRHLARSGHEVYVLSRRQTPQDLQVAYSMLHADLTGPAEGLAAQLIPLLKKGLDGCVHLAGATNPGVSGYGELAINATVLGTRNFLQALTDASRNTRTSPPPVIYASTFHVYGKNQGVISETQTPEPRSEYALTHLAAEEYCRLFYRTQALPGLSLRLTNCYGAPFTTPFTQWQLLLPDLCRMAALEHQLVLRSVPGTQRDFVWLGDVAVCCERLLALLPSRPDLAGRTFNLGGQSADIKDVADLVADVYQRRTGCGIPVLLPGGQKEKTTQLTVDTSRLRSVLPDLVFHDRMAEEIEEILARLETGYD